MARKKQRSVYVTKETNGKLKLITEAQEQEATFRSCEYFVRLNYKTKGMPL